MNTRIAFALLFALSAVAGCKRDAQPAKPANGGYAVQTWVLPSGAGSMAPDLSLAPGGRLIMSWVNRTPGRRNALQFASYTEKDGWQSQPRTIAVGNSLLANAADAPHLLATADGALWAQWLQSEPDSPAGYGVMLARSRDGGMRWENMTQVNTDKTATEHGFATLWPRGEDSIGIAWLDGRETGPDGGATQVRSNDFDMDLRRKQDTVLDERACDCCQTDVALTAKGPLLAYRDRDANEVRDIAVARFEGDKWSAPTRVHADGWRVEACPVAGPAVAAAGNTAVLAWYSEAQRSHALRLARSTDAGDSFGAPVVVDEGKPVLGRVDVAMDAQQVWVAWLREDGQGQALMLARYAPNLSKQLQKFEVAKLGARGLASGYPKLVADGGMAWLVWTDTVNGQPQLKGARITR